MMQENIKLIEQTISLSELIKISKDRYGDMVKAVVDIEKGIMAIGADMHVDEETFLLDNGSIQDNLWGINLYHEDFGTDDFVEFDSMINIRPRQNNRSRSVGSEEIRKKIIEVVGNLIIK